MYLGTSTYLSNLEPEPHFHSDGMRITQAELADKPQWQLNWEKLERGATYLNRVKLSGSCLAGQHQPH